MKKLMVIALFTFVTSASAYGQSDHPKFQVFGGYSHFSADVRFDDPFDNDGNDFFNQREGLHGFGFSGAANFSKHLGVVGDFSYHKRAIELGPGSDIDFSTFNFLFGPRFTARGDRVEGFVHGLVGGVSRKVENFDSDVDLALGVGAGIDIKVSRNFGIRLVQIDYIPFRDTNPFTLDKEWRDNLRVQVGATFSFD